MRSLAPRARLGPISRFGPALFIAAEMFACEASAVRYETEWTEPEPCVDRPDEHRYCIGSNAPVLGVRPGDGSDEIVVMSSGRTTRYHWDGLQTVSSPPVLHGSSRISDETRVLTCDVDGNGVHDLVLSRLDAEPEVLVWGDGTAEHPTGAVATVGDARLQGARCEDVDGDGRADLVGFSEQNVLAIWPGTASGFDLPGVSIPVDLQDASFFFQRAVAVDLNGDDRTEVVYGRLGGDRLTINTLDPASASAAFIGAIDLPRDSLHRIEAFDLDGGAPEVIVGGEDAEGGWLVVASVGDDGSVLALLELETAEAPRRIRPFDRDQDGDEEMLVVGSEVDGVYVVDLVDGELVVVASFDAPSLDAVPVHFFGTAQWDLAVSLAGEGVLQVFTGALTPAD